MLKLKIKVNYLINKIGKNNKVKYNIRQEN